MEANKGILVKVSKMYTNTAEDQEDLQQEILVRLWTNYQQFEGKSAFSTWMYRVAVNTALTFLRKEKRRPVAAAEPDALQELAAEPVTDQAKQMQTFYRAAQELTPIEKAVIFYFMEGLSHREIGSHLGITENNARVKLSRTKEKLQHILKLQGYES